MTEMELEEARYPRALRGLLIGGVSAVALAMTPAFAQDDVERVDEEESEEADDSGDTVVVTGSRIRRDTFDSIAPLQVIDTETTRAAGLFDTADIVKSQSVTNGVQLNTDISNAFVTDAGPGGSAVALRGLGSDRTLVLINGRRVAPAGVEGAPSFVDLNLIPSAALQRVETLLDGAGSVYGSDAVAGVINLILRDDFEGLRLEFSGDEPLNNGGRSGLFSVLAGTSSDTGRYQVAAEYFEQSRVLLNELSYTKGDITGLHCSLDIEVDAAGNEVRVCDDGAVSQLEFRSASSPLGDAGPSPFAAPGSGFNSISDTDLLPFRSVQQSELDEVVNNFSRFSVFFTGEQELDLGLFETNLFMEALYANRQTRARNGFHGQLFPTVAATNPTSPFGFDAVPVISSPIQRSDVDTEVQQIRLLAGLEGDFDFAPEWGYETFISYSRSQGYSTRPAVLEERLFLSLDTTVENPDGTLSCGNPTVDLFGFNSQQPCVPIDLFAPSLYDPLNPQFATQAELDYISGERTVTSFNDQLLFGGFVTGPVFELPAGEVNVVLGYEYRDDSVETRTDTVAATGGAAGFFADRPSIGSVYTSEIYGEVVVPLVKNKPWVYEASIEAAGRVIFNELFDQTEVYSVKASYSPVEWFGFRATYGTSFRAPGLRELFLGGQSGFVAAGNDPCIVPVNARLDDDNDPNTPPVYDPTGDDRDPIVLANCTADGADPTTLGLEGSSSIEAFRSGNSDLQPETSQALTAGFTLDQPWFDAFDLRFGFNYFEVEVEDATANPSAGFILSECYNSIDFPNDPFCQRRVRDPDTGFLQEIDQTPFNLGFFNSKGMDFNLAGNWDFDAAGKPFTLAFDSQVTYQLENQFQNLPDSPVGDSAGDIGTPEFRSVSNVRLTTGPWTAFYRLQHIGSQDNLNATTGEFNPTFPNAENLLTGQPLDTVDAASNSIDSYFNHTISMQYAADTWSARIGVQNLTDTLPPQIDEEAGFTGFYNVPLGVGYDVLGRSIFVNVVKEF